MQTSLQVSSSVGAELGSMACQGCWHAGSTGLEAQLWAYGREPLVLVGAPFSFTPAWRGQVPAVSSLGALGRAAAATHVAGWLFAAPVPARLHQLPQRGLVGSTGFPPLQVSRGCRTYVCLFINALATETLMSHIRKMPECSMGTLVPEARTCRTVPPQGRRAIPHISVPPCH